MPRPKKPKFLSGYPTIVAFVPQGMPVAGEVFLSVEEHTNFEAGTDVSAKEAEEIFD